MKQITVEGGGPRHGGGPDAMLSCLQSDKMGSLSLGVTPKSRISSVAPPKVGDQSEENSCLTGRSQRARFFTDMRKSSSLLQFDGMDVKTRFEMSFLKRLGPQELTPGTDGKRNEDSLRELRAGRNAMDLLLHQTQIEDSGAANELNRYGMTVIDDETRKKNPKKNDDEAEENEDSDLFLAVGSPGEDTDGEMDESPQKDTKFLVSGTTRSRRGLKFKTSKARVARGSASFADYDKAIVSKDKSALEFRLDSQKVEDSLWKKTIANIKKISKGKKCKPAEVAKELLQKGSKAYGFWDLDNSSLKPLLLSVAVFLKSARNKEELWEDKQMLNVDPRQSHFRRSVVVFGGADMSIRYTKLSYGIFILVLSSTYGIIVYEKPGGAGKYLDLWLFGARGSALGTLLSSAMLFLTMSRRFMTSVSIF